MSVLQRIVAGVVVGAAAVTLTACSSTVGGHDAGPTGPTPPGSASGESAAHTTAHTTRHTATHVATAAAGSQATSHHHSGSGSGDGSSHSATTSATASTSTSDAPLPLPQIDSYTATVVTSDCSTSGGSTTGTVSVKLTWTSSYASSAWIGGSQVAFSFDAPSTGGSLPANGSQTVSFGCENDYYYYELGVYNATGHTFQVDQVVNPAG